VIVAVAAAMDRALAAGEGVCGSHPAVGKNRMHRKGRKYFLGMGAPWESYR
jgi:hypothetical protein